MNAVRACLEIWGQEIWGQSKNTALYFYSDPKFPGISHMGN